jgi:hypothetical protein
VPFTSWQRIKFGLLLIAAFPAIVVSAPAVQPGLTIKLRAYNYADVGNRTLEGAQREVTSIFNQIGVGVKWVTDDNPQFRIFVVQSTPDPVASSEDVFGFTPRNPDGAHSSRAFVIYDRVQKFILDSKSWRYPPLETVHLLAYVMAHEISHLLLPPKSHSPIGIMHERWADNDFKAMATANLTFTAQQASLIRNAVSRLSER